MNVDAVQTGDTKIDLLIAIVKYKTVIKRIRQGVATRYIASLTPGQEINVTLSKGGLGARSNETERPVVMVGPGTGVAPMRSLIYQRIQWRKELGLSNGNDKASNEQMNDVLFFGCRNAESDYFFKHEWEHLSKTGVPLEVFAAFSRDQVRPLTSSITTLPPTLTPITAPKGLRARPHPPAICTHIQCPRYPQRHHLHLRLLR